MRTAFAFRSGSWVVPCHIRAVCLGGLKKALRAKRGRRRMGGSENQFLRIAKKKQKSPNRSQGARDLPTAAAGRGASGFTAHPRLFTGEGCCCASEGVAVYSEDGWNLTCPDARWDPCRSGKNPGTARCYSGTRAAALAPWPTAWATSRSHAAWRSARASASWSVPRALLKRRCPSRGDLDRASKTGVQSGLGRRQEDKWADTHPLRAFRPWALASRPARS